MNPFHILIVDDEPNVRLILEHALKHEGYVLETAAHGAEAIQKIGQAYYDLIVLDLYMQPVDGLQVLYAARKQDAEVIIIILTANSSVESAIEALRWGVFDYLLKPVSPESLRQRVRQGLTQRQQTLQQKQLLQQINHLRETFRDLDNLPSPELTPPTLGPRFIYAGSLVLDCHHRQATLNQTTLDLTTSEFDLLLCLVKATPNPMSPRQLVNCALGYDCDEVRAKETIKWHIHHLRRKVETDPNTPHYIKTVRYKGYMWSGE